MTPRPNRPCPCHGSYSCLGGVPTTSPLAALAGRPDPIAAAIPLAPVALTEARVREIVREMLLDDLPRAIREGIEAADLRACAAWDSPTDDATSQPSVALDLGDGEGHGP